MQKCENTHTCERNIVHSFIDNKAQSNSDYFPLILSHIERHCNTVNLDLFLILTMVVWEEYYKNTHACCIAAGVGRAFSRICLFACLFVRALKGKRLELSTPMSVNILSTAGHRHSPTLRSKGQRSNPNPNPRVRALTFAMGMGRDAEQREYVYVYTTAHFYTCSVFLSSVNKWGFARRGSACRYDCTFL